MVVDTAGHKFEFSPVRRERFNPSAHAQELKKIKICFLGDSDVGKSSLCTTLAERNLSALCRHNMNLFTTGSGNSGSSLKTVGVDLCSFLILKDRPGAGAAGRGAAAAKMNSAFRTYQVNIWDLGGGPQFDEIRTEFYKESHLVCLVCDAGSRRSQASLESWYQEVRKSGNEGATVKMCVVVNKSDSTQANSSTCKEWAKAKNVPVFEVSATAGTNVNMLLEYFVQECG
ncbi:unnamed protein product [Amoebophrya sp. A25]|nr:unnamed protein product [Amoebophrya sp. A25]|eukprot:GSA25T00017668001.1